jgi:valyl-tRNA synthetase
MVKPVLLGRHGTDHQRAQSKRVLLEVLDRSLRLLHPFMPFVTEEIWLKLGGVEPSVMVAPYPVGEEVLDDPEAARMLGAVKSMITAVRNARAERGFTPKDRFTLYIGAVNEREATFFANHEYLLNDLARLDKTIVNGEAPQSAHHDVIGGFEIAIVFPEKVATPEQAARKQKEIENSRKELASLDAKLSNEQFVSKAPPAVVQQAQARQSELRARIQKLEQNQ